LDPCAAVQCRESDTFVPDVPASGLTTENPGTGEPPVQVLVADDSEPFRALLRDLVAAAAGMTCVGEVESGEAALAAVDRLRPQMVVMDKRMPGLGGIAAARAIKARHPAIVVVLVSIEEPEEEALDASGAAAFLNKRELSPRALAEVWVAHRPA
jgi:DNA-binding NarL/FixJ family response regulator